MEKDIKTYKTMMVILDKVLVFSMICQKDSKLEFILILMMQKMQVQLRTLSFFLGYKGDGGRLGLEYNKLNNARNYKSSQDGYNRDGFSIYGSKKLPKNYELFVRYDQITSNILNGESKAWNYNNDGSLLMFGTQYQAIKGVKFNINYRLFTHDNSIINNKSILSLNAEFKI